MLARCLCSNWGWLFGGALIGWMLAYGGYDAAEKAQNSATISIIIALFTIVPAICYLLSAIIAKHFTTHSRRTILKTVMERAGPGRRRCQQQDFTSAPIDKEVQGAKGTA
ncbi:hypothetical protein MJ391_27600 [Escherichia coli]|nr:hypothetical protein MJ391_27600 [Escherichia coli]